MQIKILGKSPSWPDAGGACSGYLVCHEGYTLLLDCGNGVFSKLRSVIDYGQVDAVLISHLHADHFLDLIPFSYALLHSPREGVAAHEPPPLHAPPGAAACFRRVTGAWGPEALVEEAFALREYSPAEALRLGPLQATFCEVPHYTRSFAVELAAGGCRFTFGADCGPNPQLPEFARDTDLLMLEATVPHPDEKNGHMTPSEAGELARQAGARRLVLTHFTDELDAGAIRREAAQSYGHEVALAAGGMVLSLTDGT